MISKIEKYTTSKINILAYNTQQLLTLVNKKKKKKKKK